MHLTQAYTHDRHVALRVITLHNCSLLHFGDTFHVSERSWASQRLDRNNSARCVLPLWRIMQVQTILWSIFLWVHEGWHRGFVDWRYQRCSNSSVRVNDDVYYYVCQEQHAMTTMTTMMMMMKQPSSSSSSSSVVSSARKSDKDHH